MTAPKNVGSLAKTSGTAVAANSGRVPFAKYVKAPSVLKSIEQTLGSAGKRETFVAALISAVSTNPALKECEPGSIISAALLGESLKLPPSPQLGYFYMVPRNVKRKKLSDGTVIPEHKEANFQLGYKGYIQLAQRSGFFKRINVTAVKEGEFISWDPFNEELKYRLVENRNSLKTVGYYAFFELTNGFRKANYMTHEEMVDYADQYSSAYSKQTDALLKSGKIPQGEAWKYSSFWYKDFDTMAYKTMLRQLISKWAPMSVEMQKGIEGDNDTEVIDLNNTETIEFNQYQDDSAHIDNEIITDAEEAQADEPPLTLDAQVETM